MAFNNFVVNTVIDPVEVNENFQNVADHCRNFTMKWSFLGSLATQTSNDILSLPDNGTITRVDLVSVTAPVGADIIVDIERSTDGGSTWVTIFTGGTNRPKVTDGNRTGQTTTIDIPNATANSHLYRAKISQVGSTTAGADLSVMVRGTYDLD